ncbi:MAG: amino acid ABC transporter permease [Clostridia bacterium]|nr:amino acid ABC transporter permease [Clostridia bacterium]
MFWEVVINLFENFLVTLELFALTLLFALPLGLIISFGSMSRFKPLSFLVKVFVWIIRGTPLMLQLILFYFGPGLLVTVAEQANYNNFFIDFMRDLNMADPLVTAVIAFSINYACYFSEIFRGGIQGVPKGQQEAGEVLGLTKTQIFFKVTLLQMIKRIVPPMSNEIITLVKDTSLARTITVYEIIWSAQDYIRNDGLLWPLFFTGVYFLAFSGILTLLFNYIEKKLSYFKV